MAREDWLIDGHIYGLSCRKSRNKTDNNGENEEGSEGKRNYFSKPAEY